MQLTQTLTLEHQPPQALVHRETTDREELPNAQVEAVQTAAHEPAHKDVVHKLVDRVNPVAAQNERVDVVRNSVDGLTKPLP
jgi:hypothetical protein